MSRLLTMNNLKIEGYQEETWQPIVNDVSVTLERGEILGLIGESGAGKSTIGIAAMGYTRPGCRIVGGDINFDGMDLRESSSEELRTLRGARIAYVAQSAAAAFNPTHKIIEQCCETPVRHNILDSETAAQNAKQMFAKLELPDPNRIGERYPHQVSGGQLQRAMVAMAMACKPDLIIFDEPTTALDVTTQIEVLAAIKDAIRIYNSAAIYISHDLAVVAQVADRVTVLRYGREIETAATQTLINHPRDDYTAALLAVRKGQAEKTVPKQDYEILRVENVTAAYANGIPVVKNVCVTIKTGKTVAVVGESGSGKSTLARVITGLLPPLDGSIKFDGVPIAAAYKKRSKDQLRRMQMIYQMADVALNPRQKVRDIIGRPLSFYFNMTGRAKAERVRQLLDMIELGPSYADRLPSELSGGEKQRVCIARALAAEPELIICDEVTSALDQLVAEDILKLLQNLQNSLGVSYLFITHDLATVKAISDEIVVMYQGEIVEQGPRDTVLSPPHHAYTELLLSSVPEMRTDWLDTLLSAR
ncbi:MAG: ABC transporter ATP-binding protein, partial [Rhodospirillaceae bacterium]